MDIMHKLFLFAQDLYIKFNSLVSPQMIHNFEKHDAIKKALFYKFLEHVEGDYLEFGVYEGTSLKGAATYWRTISKDKMRFLGFDSFKGMKPQKGDEHPFYTDFFDFSTEFNVIRKRFRNFPEVKLIPGFFEDTLKKPYKDYGPKKAAVVLMDCDLYSAAKTAFEYISTMTQKGTIFILDDYYNYLGDKKKGIRAAFEEFANKNKMSFEDIGKYGVGGAIFLITDVKRTK